MDTFARFLYEFMSVFFSGMGMILKGFVTGIIQMFNIPEYAKLIKTYQNKFLIGFFLRVI